MEKTSLLTILLSSFLLFSCGGGSSNKSSTESGDGNGTPTPPTVVGEKLDGEYSVVVTPVSSPSSCGSASGAYTLSNEKDITGSVTDTHGTLFTVTGERKSDGSVTGGFAFSNGRKSADFAGVINSNESKGTWIDIYGCSGIWVGTKL